MENSIPQEPALSQSQPVPQQSDLVTLLSQKVVGQSAATKAIVPYVYMYQSGLAPAGRPAGVFLLLGPTGTGKTKTVEAIAELKGMAEQNPMLGEVPSARRIMGHAYAVQHDWTKAANELTLSNTEPDVAGFMEISVAFPAN